MTTFGISMVRGRLSKECVMGRGEESYVESLDYDYLDCLE